MGKYDQQAKQDLKGWGQRISWWSGQASASKWLRAQPVDGRGQTGPRIQIPGSKLFKTQPDGLFVSFESADLKFVNVIAVEACSSSQNFNDKRSRYMPATCSRVLSCPRSWFNNTIAVQSGSLKPRWEALGFGGRPPVPLVAVIPIRHERVLFAVPDALYDQIKSNSVLEPHEYACRLTSLRTQTSKKFKDFLKRLSPEQAFYNQ